MRQPHAGRPWQVSLVVAAFRLYNVQRFTSDPGPGNGVAQAAVHLIGGETPGPKAVTPPVPERHWTGHSLRSADEEGYSGAAAERLSGSEGKGGHSLK
jgi:hypothetical protein